jgi:hypothetical protein
VLFPQLLGKCQGKTRKDGARTVLNAVWLLFVLFYVVFVCKCVLPPSDNPIAVNKYIICRHFGTLCVFHLHRWVGVAFYTYLPMKMEHTECSGMLAYKIQTPGNYPEENI